MGHRDYRHHTSTEAGITLIQMAGILLIISLLMVPFFQIQTLVRKQDKYNHMKAQVSDIAEALVQYALKNGRYPRPANPYYATSNASSGVEETTFDDAGVQNTPQCGMSPPINLMTCANGVAAPFGGLPNNTDNRIVIGTVPYTVLGLTPEQSLDEFGRKFTYAVTYGLTKTTTFANDKGNIRIQDQGNGVPNFTNGKNLLKVSAYATDRVHFVVVSHGQNGLGAFPATGGNHTSCAAGAVASSLERENCDDNSDFRALSNRPFGDTTSTLYSQRFFFMNPGGNTNGTFDDSVAFRTSLNEGNWTAQRIPGSANTYQTFLSYREGGDNIVLGMTGASQTQGKYLARGTGQVQVEGGNNVKADTVISDYFCSIKQLGDNTVSTVNRAWGCLSMNAFSSTAYAITGSGGTVPLVRLVPTYTNTTSGYMGIVQRGGLDPSLENGYMKRFNPPTLQDVQIPQSNLTTVGANASGICVNGASQVNAVGGVVCDP